MKFYLLASIGAVMTLISHHGSAADVALFGVVKSTQFVQTNATPVALSSNGYAFNAFVLTTTNHVVTNAVVKPSNSTPLRTLLAESNGLAWRYEQRFDTQAALDSTYPVGTLFNLARYNFTNYTVNDGVQSANLDFLGVVLQGSPPTPVIANLAAAQSIDTTIDFTLRWNSLGNGLLDLAQVLILDGASNAIFASPAPFTDGALTGSSTSIVVPANTLPPGITLEGHLAIARPGTINSNYAVGVTAVLRETMFFVITRPEPVAPRLTVLPRVSGQFQLRLVGETNRVYQIEASPDLATWNSIFTTNSLSGTFDYLDPQTVAFPRRFYRGKVGP